MSSLVLSYFKNNPKAESVRFFADKGFWSILDQMLFAGANFSVNILLARWLPPTEYGSFAVSYALFLLLASVYTATIIEPMLVFGAGKYVGQFQSYLGILLRGHVWVTTIIALCLFFVALGYSMFSATTMAMTTIGLAISSPFILLWWLIRQVTYAQLAPRLAALGSSIFLLISLVGLFLLSHLEQLSPPLALGGMGLAGLISSAVVLSIVSPRFFLKPTDIQAKDVLASHWKFGSWNSLGALTYWASGHILVILVPMVLGLFHSAVLAAVTNLFRPIFLIMQSTANILLPKFSMLQNQGNPKQLGRELAIQFSLLISILALLYGLFITSQADWIMHFLYKGKYKGNQDLLLLFTFCVSLSGANIVLMNVLKTFGSPKLIVPIWACSALLVTTLSIPMLLLFGLAGGLGTAVVSYTIALILAWRKVRTLLQ